MQVVINTGKEIQVVADSPSDPSLSTCSKSAEGKYFDVIGFDPRGVNNSTPHISCFPDSVSRRAWYQQTSSEIISTSPESFTRLWESAKAMAAGCSEQLLKGDAVASYIGTASVVRDMVEIVEQHGRWREKEAERLLAQANPEILGLEMRDTNSLSSVVERTRWKKGEEKLFYWGFSYGTVLGATFATTHPHRVSRLIFDGVVDAADWYRGNWAAPHSVADLIRDKFTEYCFQAGPLRCPFFTGTSPSDIKESFQSLFTKLKDNPVGVPGDATRGPQIITWTDAKYLVWMAMYSPLARFDQVATLLADLRDGTGIEFAEQKRAGQSLPSSSSSSFPDELQPGENADEASTAILCADSDDIADLTPAEFQPYWDALRQDSEVSGDIWAQIRIRCVGWKARSKWRFTGPFGGVTAHPILFIGNTLDAATPLNSARIMSNVFMGSAVLEQDSEGHGSLTSPSICTAKVVREYFQTGGLPEARKVCAVDQKPFLGWVGRRNADLDEEEKVLKDVTLSLSAKW